MKLLRTFVLAAIFPLMSEAAFITGGTITITGSMPVGAFNFSGSDFSDSGAFGFSNWGLIGTIPGVPSGTVVGVNGFVVGTDFQPGSATVGGTNFVVNWGGINPASTSVFSIGGPPITLDHGPGTYLSTFTFNGGLCGIQSTGAAVEPCVVDQPILTGEGVVTANFTQGALGLFYTSATYTFVIPEPSTWALFAFGGAAVLAFLRVRRA